MEVTGKLQAPAALPTRIRPQYPFDRRLGEPEVQHHMEKRNISCPFPESNHDCPAHSLVAMPTELFRIFFYNIMLYGLKLGEHYFGLGIPLKIWMFACAFPALTITHFVINPPLRGGSDTGFRAAGD
jgi:hypothetical protein